MLRLAIPLQQELRDENDEDAIFSMNSLIGQRYRDMDEATRKETYDECLSEVIEGRDDTFRSLLVKAYPTIEGMDRISAELIAGELCDPFAVLAIACAMNGFALIMDGATDEKVLGVRPRYVDGDNDDNVWVTLAPGVEWWSDGHVVMTLPETVRQASIGRKLRELLSHPVLDRYDLTITGLDNWQDGTGLLAVDHDMASISMAELMEIRPTGIPT